MVWIADALGVWLVETLADAGRKKLIEFFLGDEFDRAIHLVATRAVQATARELSPDDEERADHIALVITEIFAVPVPVPERFGARGTLLEALRAGIADQIALLEDPEITGAGQSAVEALDISAGIMAPQLTRHLVGEVISDGWRGGPLFPLASQLNADIARVQDQQTQDMLRKLGADILAAINRIDQQHVDREGVESRQAGRGRPIRAGFGRPVADWRDPIELEVHEAIEAGEDNQRLPSYIQREHDVALRTQVTRAAGGQSAIVILVGGSSTGKTRACWEAVQAEPSLHRDWLLWHPIDPTPAEALADALEKGIRQRTVLWLDEIQRYLLTPGSALGERIAAGLRELLRDPDRGPILVLGTVWPEQLAGLTAPSSSGGDSHGQARVLLTGVTITVPGSFDDVALHQLRKEASTDLRLAEAERNAQDGQITQYLAGVPFLLERYRNAPDAGAAVMQAATDAVRIGNLPTLSLRLLREATEGYLTPLLINSYDDDMFLSGLAYCTEPCRGVAGLLVRIPSANTANSSLQFKISDYLDQYSREFRRNLIPPAALWDSLAANVFDPNLLGGLGDKAAERSYYRYSAIFYRKAAETGDARAMRRLARCLHQAGNVVEAEQWLRNALKQEKARNDNTAQANAAEELSDFLTERKRHDDAESIWLDLIGSHPSIAFEKLADWRWRHTWEGINGWGEDPFPMPAEDDVTEVVKRVLSHNEVDNWVKISGKGATHLVRLYQMMGMADKERQARVFAANQGDINSMLWLARQGDQRQLARAVTWYRQRATAGGYADALRDMAQLLNDCGRPAEARSAWLELAEHIRPKAEAGDADAMRRLAWRLSHAGDFKEAEPWLRRAAEHGDRTADSRLREYLERTGRIDDAIEAIRKSRHIHEGLKLHEIDNLLDRVGRGSEVTERLAANAETGDSNAMANYGNRLLFIGENTEGQHWLARAARAGNRQAPLTLFAMLNQAGDPAEAENWLRYAAERGHLYAMKRLAERLRETGHPGEADEWSLKASEQNSANEPERKYIARLAEGKFTEVINMVMRNKEGNRDYEKFLALIKFLKDRNMSEHLEGLLRYVLVADPGYHWALRELADLLHRQAKGADADKMYRRLVQYGSYGASDTLVRFLRDTGRANEASEVQRYGLEPGGATAAPW